MPPKFPSTPTSFLHPRSSAWNSNPISSASLWAPPHGESTGDIGDVPTQILLFLGNLWDFAEQDRDTFIDEVHLTYLHELGHYFGWNEDDLAARDLD